MFHILFLCFFFILHLYIKKHNLESHVSNAPWNLLGSGVDSRHARDHDIAFQWSLLGSFDLRPVIRLEGGIQDVKCRSFILFKIFCWLLVNVYCNHIWFIYVSFLLKEHVYDSLGVSDPMVFPWVGKHVILGCYHAAKNCKSRLHRRPPLGITIWQQTTLSTGERMASYKWACFAAASWKNGCHSCWRSLVFVLHEA